MFHYKNNLLYIDQINIADIAKQIHTPFYLYSATQLKENFLKYKNAFADQNVLICFAVKANSNLSVLNALGKLGSGADCVSEGEIRKAIAADIPPKHIVFSGVGKTKQELSYALSENIMQFNVESIPELLLLNDVAGMQNKIANVAIRINANVDGKTHYKINTGLKSNKFGIDIDNLTEIVKSLEKLNNIKLQGLSIHIGSQITSLEPYKEAYQIILKTAEMLKSHGCKIEYLDLGGGLGVRYSQENPPEIAEYAELIKKLFYKSNYKIIIEPGRSIAANIGVLISSVLYIKETKEKTFAIIDAGMNDSLRQSLYDAYHDIVPLSPGNTVTKYDIVGPVCETSDVFSKDKIMPNLNSGDLVAFKDAGAYGAVMSSIYNSRLLIPEVIAQDTKFAITKNRPSYEDLIKSETIPSWI
jgi:diaminopimelate decarboxylase